MVKYQVVNVVTTALLSQKIDFDELRKHDEIFHDPDVYGGRVAYFKTRQMVGRVEIFPSGKMISVGAKNEAQATKELFIGQQFLVEKGLVKCVELQPKTRKIVVSADSEQLINLEELSERTNAIYEPDQN